jgi:2-iminobutanoate/2-iminopropanoate deaminase
MKRQIIRVEPLASLLEKYNAPTSTVVRHGDTLYVTGAPPFEPKTGEIVKGRHDQAADRTGSRADEVLP